MRPPSRRRLLRATAAVLAAPLLPARGQAPGTPAPLTIGLAPFLSPAALLRPPITHNCSSGCTCWSPA